MDMKNTSTFGIMDLSRITTKIEGCYYYDSE